MTDIGTPEKEYEITPLIEPLPQVIELPETPSVPAPAPQPVREPVKI